MKNELISDNGKVRSKVDYKPLCSLREVGNYVLAIEQGWTGEKYIILKLNNFNLEELKNNF